MKPAAIGFRMHSGWGVLVAVSASAGIPELLERKRITLIDAASLGAKQPYHFAANLPLSEAETHIRACAVASETLALAEIRNTQHDLRERGYDLQIAAMLLASPRSLPLLADILRAHPLIHTAEGEFFRKVVQEACERLRIPLTGLREREIEQRAKSQFGAASSRQIRNIQELGRRLGPPWTQDYKQAALAAWILLAERITPRVGVR